MIECLIALHKSNILNHSSKHSGTVVYVAETDPASALLRSSSVTLKTFSFCTTGKPVLYPELIEGMNRSTYAMKKSFPSSILSNQDLLDRPNGPNHISSLPIARYLEEKQRHTSSQISTDLSTRTSRNPRCLSKWESRWHVSMPDLV